MRVLVTGASGLIGTHTVEALHACGVEPVAFDVEPPAGGGGGNVPNVPFVRGDVTDRHALLSALRVHGISRIVHLAAVLQRSSQEDPALAATVNVGGSIAVLEAARELSIRRVVVASSIAVYGNVRYDPVDELHPLSPHTVYGAAKLFVENAGRAYRERHGIEFIALRYGATYGPGPVRMASVGAATDLRTFFEEAIRRREVVLSDPDAKRPLVYVKDAARGTALACLAEPAPAACALNVAGDRAASMAECAAVLAGLLPGLRILRRDRPGGTPPMIASLAIDRAQSELGYRPRYPLEAGIADYVRTLEGAGHRGPRWAVPSRD